MEGYMEEQAKFEGYAIVELMGRSVIAGYVSEQVIAGAAMLRVDVPETDQAGPFTKFFGGSAIFGIAPTTEEIARRAASRLNVRAVEPWIVPTPAARPVLVDSMSGEDDQDEYDEDDEDDEPLEVSGGW
jgi:hypothetical protein